MLHPQWLFFAYSELYIPCVFTVMSSIMNYSVQPSHSFNSSSFSLTLPRVPRALLICSCPSGAICRSLSWNLIYTCLKKAAFIRERFTWEHSCSTVGTTRYYVEISLYTRTIINNNHNYNKIPKSDWLSTVLISALIGLYGSCLSNWIVRDITRALKWSFFFSLLAKKPWNFLCFDLTKRAFFDKFC